MESPMKAMSHGPGLSLARCKTCDWRLVAPPVRGTGMMAGFARAVVSAGAAAGAAGCAKSETLSSKTSAKLARIRANDFIDDAGDWASQLEESTSEIPCRWATLH